MYIGSPLWYDDTINENAERQGPIMNRKLAATLQMLLPVLAALAIFAGAFMQVERPAEGGWMGNAAEVAETMAKKPHNTWTTKALEGAGFKGCVAVEGDQVSYDNPPVAHVVRLPVAEGWHWVEMKPAEVACRIEAFGGTSTTRDDVKLVGNCY